MKNIFADKNIVITGGASGIGASLVARFKELGANVAIIDRSAQTGGTQLYIQADLAEYDQAEQAFKLVLQKMEHIDYFINNAGIFMGGEISKTPIKNWHTVIDNNIYAVSHGAHLALQQMIKQKSGHIINVASTAGLIPVPFMGIYGATKYALVGLSHAMRNEAISFNVKVSVVCPTIVDTPLYDTAIYNDVNKDRILRSRDKLQSPETAARKIIHGIVRNKATIHTSFATHFIWIIQRLFPALYDIGARKLLSSYRSS